MQTTSSMLSCDDGGSEGNENKLQKTTMATRGVEKDSFSQLLTWDATVAHVGAEGNAQQNATETGMGIEDWIQSIRQKSERIAADTFKNITDGNSDIGSFQSKEKREVNPWDKKSKEGDESIRKLLEAWVKVEDEAESMKQGSSKDRYVTTNQSVREAYMLSSAAKSDPVMMMEARHEKARRMRAERTNRQQLLEQERRRALEEKRDTRDRREALRLKQDIDVGRQLPWEAEENDQDMKQPKDQKHGKQSIPVEKILERRPWREDMKSDVAQIQQFNKEMKRRLETEQAETRHWQEVQQNMQREAQERDKIQRKLKEVQKLKKEKMREIENEKRIESDRLARRRAKYMLRVTRPILRKTVLFHSFVRWNQCAKYARMSEPARLALLKKCFQAIKRHSQPLSEKRRVSFAFSRFHILDRHWRAWAQWVKQVQMAREHAVIESRLKRERQLQLMAVGHFSKVILQKSVTSWVRWVRGAQEQRHLEREKQARLKMAQKRIKEVKSAFLSPDFCPSQQHEQTQDSSLPTPPPEALPTSENAVRPSLSLELDQTNSALPSRSHSSSVVSQVSTSRPSSTVSQGRQSEDDVGPTSSKRHCDPPPTPKEIAGMRKREVERQQRRALLKSKYLEREDMRLREQARQEQDTEQRKTKEEQDRRDKVRRLKQEQKEREEELKRQRMVANHANSLARMHHKQSLMIYYGFRPWKRFIRMRELALEKAAHWFLDNSKQRFFTLWVSGVQRVKIQKLTIANNFYFASLTRKIFRSLKTLILIYRQHTQRARALCRRHRLNRIWKQWNKSVGNIRLRVGMKMTIAQEHATRAWKILVMHRWKRNMVIWKEQALVEKEKKMIRGQVDGWLKDYSAKSRNRKV